MPEWVNQFLRGGIPGLEAIGAYQNRYVFVGKNKGNNFSALQQWAENFSPVQDFPRLAAARIEHRLISAASLYPDDEYGDYFEFLIKSASDAEYAGALKEESFWIKQRVEHKTETADSEETDQSGPPLVEEVYEFFVLISIDKTILQTRIREFMAGIKPAVPPSRAQKAAINRVQQIFFEGF
ncbi:hypothetical protein AGMMS50293_23570 [Spirochaetia bacterium]|nr:hypothetical protein AGMMS50293_23570 [Spirochaetia bacterium]